MTYTFIVTFCILILLAYVFDLTTSKTKIPSVILLLFLGWGLRQLTHVFRVEIPNLDPLLPMLGAIGLIVIVLEGSLELDFNKSKLKIVRQAGGMAIFQMLVLGFLMTIGIYYFMTNYVTDPENSSFKIILLNVIPLSIISSSVAIPSAINLSKINKELVTYESSLSDILGVLFFNFIARNAHIDFQSFGIFLLQLLIITIVSILATVGLSYLLGKINHKTKFLPILILAILIYSVAEIYHLPALIFIMLFGLVLGNLDQLKHIRGLKAKKVPDLETEVKKFYGVLKEATFFIRSMFFLLFGFFIKTKDILNKESIPLAVGIVILILIVRFIFIKILKLSWQPLLFIIPRGLVTILLFLSVSDENRVFLLNKSLLIQIIILTVLIMMLGLLFTGKKETLSLIKLPGRKFRLPVKKEFPSPNKKEDN